MTKISSPATVKNGNINPPANLCQDLCQGVEKTGFLSLQITEGFFPRDINRVLGPPLRRQYMLHDGNASRN